MPRPSSVTHVWDLPGEKRPRFTQGGSVASVVRLLGDTTGLTRMGVTLRVIDAGAAGTHRHFHMVEEEWAYVVSGRGTVRIGPHRLPVRAGSFAGFPPGPRPHHFLADAGERIVLLEGGERRPREDYGWYVDAGRMWRAGKFIEPAEPLPGPEEGSPEQCVQVDDLATYEFRHDVDATARRTMRELHKRTGLTRQAVYWSRVEPGERSTAFHRHERTDEWIFVLAGRGRARVGDDRFEIGQFDFLAHPAGGAAHVMEAIEPLLYLMGGEIDPSDVVVYPDAGVRRTVRGIESRPDQKPG